VGSLGKSGPFDTLPATAFDPHVLWRKALVLLCLAWILYDMANIPIDCWTDGGRVWLLNAGYGRANW